MKKKANFIEEMQNSQQFLSKLKGFQKASKDIKQKNKLVSHRNIWVKQFKYLHRLERDADFQLNQYFSVFDKYMEYQIDDKQVFGRDPYKSYSQMLKNSDQQFQIYENSIWQQLRSLPLLIDKTKQMSEKDKKLIDFNDISAIIHDIGGFLIEKQQQNQASLYNMQRQSILVPKALNTEQNQQENQYMFLQTILGKGNTSGVKGFDFQMEQKKRIQEGQAHLTNYLEEFQAHLTRDEISEVIQQYQHASELLNQTFELEVEKINLDYQEALSLDEAVVGNSQNYQKINHIYNTYIGRGKLIKLYYQRLSIEFPKINRKILERITEYISAKIYKQKKISAIRRNYWRQKQQLLNKVQKQVNERVQSKIMKAQKEAQRLLRKQQKLKLEIELEKMRKEYSIRKQEEQKLAKQQEEKNKQQERRKDAIRRLYLDELNKKAAQVIEIKTKKQQEQQKKLREQQKAKEFQRKKLIEQNKPRIQKRQSNEKRKLQKKLDELKERKDEPMKKQQRINKAVQKYSFRPEIQASEDRLNAPTEAMLKKKQLKYDKADKIELTKVNGYNINQLMGDMRYKLNTALQEAGLSNTDYARQLLNKMSKRQ